jgi:hypothetical protein
VSEPLNRSTFPRPHEEVLLPTLRDEIPFIRRYLEQPTWRIWLDVGGLLTAALLLAHWALWGL